jgi:hypothetical protein
LYNADGNSGTFRRENSKEPRDGSGFQGQLNLLLSRKMLRGHEAYSKVLLIIVFSRNKKSFFELRALPQVTWKRAGGMDTN